MAIIIGISGKMKSGKDTLASILFNSLKSEKSVTIISFANVLKEITSYILSKFDKKFDKKLLYSQEGKESFFKPLYVTLREFLQKFGCFMRDLNQDCWINYVKSEMNKYDVVIIPDVRFQNEAEFVQKNGILVRLESKRCLKSDHISETELDEWEFNHVYHNDGTIEDLKMFASFLVSDI